MSYRYPATQGQRDSNEAEIIAALEKVGATVEQIPTGKGVPDLLVGKDMPCPHCGAMFPQNVLEEVKPEPVKGKVFASHVKLNYRQLAWHEWWRGQKAVVRTPEEALEVIGINCN